MLVLYTSCNQLRCTSRRQLCIEIHVIIESIKTRIIQHCIEWASLFSEFSMLPRVDHFRLSDGKLRTTDIGQSITQGKFSCAFRFTVGNKSVMKTVFWFGTTKTRTGNYSLKSRIILHTSPICRTWKWLKIQNKGLCGNDVSGISNVTTLNFFRSLLLLWT